jgi:hypothetical protein
MLAQRQLFVIIKRDFRDGEIKKKISDKSIFVKSHFAGRDFGERRENSGKRLGTNTYLGSLTSKTKRDFGEKLIRGRRETSEAERGFVEKKETSGKFKKQKKAQSPPLK